jgi:hypothetical protein
LNLWWYLWWLFRLLFHFGRRPLCLLLLVLAIIRTGLFGLCLLLWSRCAGSSRLIFFLPYDELGVKL